MASQVPVRFTRRWRSHSSSEVSTMVLRVRIPALVTSPSTGPTSAMRSSQASSSATSRRRTPLSSWMSTATTAHPRLLNTSQQAAPIPDAAPVTRTRFMAVALLRSMD